MMSHSNADQLDVAALLESLRAEVRARRGAGSPAEADPLQRDLQRALDEIELYRVISAHWPLVGTTLPQRAMALVNKLVRRYLRWYINPIVEQQNAYNDAVARTLRLLAEAYGDLAATSDEGRRTEDGGRRTEDRGRRTKDVVSKLPTTNDQLPTTKDVVSKLPTTSDQLPTATSQLQALVRARATAEPPARFPDLELRAQELQLRLRQSVTAHWPLGGATLSQRAVALVNKLVRRYLRWYINPIVEQQNAANSAITVALLALVRLDAERRAQAAARRAATRSQ